MSNQEKHARDYTLNQLDEIIKTERERLLRNIYFVLRKFVYLCSEVSTFEDYLRVTSDLDSRLEGAINEYETFCTRYNLPVNSFKSPMGMLRTGKDIWDWFNLEKDRNKPLGKEGIAYYLHREIDKQIAPLTEPEKAEGEKEKVTPERSPDMPRIININNPRDVILTTAPTYGNMQIGNNIVTILPLLNRLYSSNFGNAEIRKISQEFQTIYDKLDEQEKTKLRDDVKKLINEKANKDSGFKEKLKHFGKRVATEGWDVAKGVLTAILTECVKGL